MDTAPKSIILCLVTVFCIAHCTNVAAAQQEQPMPAAVNNGQVNPSDSKPFNEAEKVLGVNLEDPIIREAALLVEDGTFDAAISKLKDRLADKTKSKDDGSTDDVRLGLVMTYIRTGKIADARAQLETLGESFKKPQQRWQARMLRGLIDAHKQEEKLHSRDFWFGALRRFRTEAWERMAKCYEKLSATIEGNPYLGIPDQAAEIVDRASEALAARVPDKAHSDADFIQRVTQDIDGIIAKIQREITTLKAKRADSPELKNIDEQVRAAEDAIRKLQNIREDARKR